MLFEYQHKIGVHFKPEGALHFFFLAHTYLIYKTSGLSRESQHFQREMKNLISQRQQVVIKQDRAGRQRVILGNAPSSVLPLWRGLRMEYLKRGTDTRFSFSS